MKAEPCAGDDAILGEINGSENVLPMTQDLVGDEVQWHDDEEKDCESCSVRGAIMPPFVMAAHQRYHILGHEQCSINIHFCSGCSSLWTIWMLTTM